MKTGRLVQLAPKDAAAAFRFCELNPFHTTFIAGWIAEGGLAENPLLQRAWLLASLDEGRHIQGLLYLSDTGIAIPVLRSERGLDEAAMISRRHPNAIRVLVGDRHEVAGLWARLRIDGADARLLRDQLGYVLEKEALVGPEAISLEEANESHVPLVVQASAAMAREEARDDPQARNPLLFERRIRERLARRRDFVHLQDGELVFKSNVASISSVGGQVEGIYTTPKFRRMGYGIRGTAAVSRWVLDRSSRAFLLVNDDNEAAKDIYEALGYKMVVESRTIFLAP